MVAVPLQYKNGILITITFRIMLTQGRVVGFLASLYSVLNMIWFLFFQSISWWLHVLIDFELKLLEKEKQIGIWNRNTVVNVSIMHNAHIVVFYQTPRWMRQVLYIY